MEVEESKIELQEDSASEKDKPVLMSPEVKAILEKMYPMRNIFSFGGKGGIVVSSEFDGGNLALCQQTY